MLPSHSGSFRLFRFAGIQVFLHWSWFLVALYGISTRVAQYSSPIWAAAEYVTLFVIVTLHEFGHSLACRQTGGQADQIVLWPLGGIAYVAPPQRPGATLWSIAAGPLVNVVLVPVFFAAFWVSRAQGWSDQWPNLDTYIISINFINGLLLAFNLAPVYPLDGGQILRSLLWYPLGRARSLQIAAIIGLAGVVVGAVWRITMSQTSTNLIWTAILALFLGQRCWEGLKEARILTALRRMPRHTGFACPSCHEPPPGGPMWLCPACGQRMDPFSTEGVCPHCRSVRDRIPCAHCGADNPIADWRTEPPKL